MCLARGTRLYNNGTAACEVYAAPMDRIDNEE